MQAVPAAPDQSAKLVAADVTHAFGGVRALDGVIFWVPEGGAVGLIGQNGSGKTTLLNVLAGQIRPQAGHIILDGREMTGASAEEFARVGIGRVFQSVQVFPHLTLLENLVAAQMGRGGGAHGDAAAARRILERMGLGAEAPQWACDVSYGHQRLLEIAMALAADTEIILLDEPTAGLGPAMLERIIPLLREVNAAGTALVLIEHETDIVFSVCDTVWVINEGKMIARGSPEAIRSDPQVLELYLGETEPC